jgi:hypothetical protein
MVSMGFLIMIPSVSADVGTIITTDTDGAPDNYFREDDYIYYQIAMPIVYAGEQVKITIADEVGTQVHTNFEDLDSNAEYKSWNPSIGQSFDSYYITGSEAVGPNWNISVFNATTLELLNWHIFEVYVPSVWTATIKFYEDSLHMRPTTQFPIDSRVYYTVMVVDEHDAPFQWDWVDIFVEHNSDKYNVDDIWLDSEGFGDDDFEIDWYWFSTSDQIGSYTMEVQEPLGTPLVNTADFIVYEPIFTASIKTYTGGYTTSATVFPVDGEVYWTAHIEDQHGKNISSGTSVYLQIEHDGDIWRFWADSADNNGNASGDFWLWSSPWDDDEQIGLYIIRVSDGQYNDPFQGSMDIEVISLELSPDKDKYSQGEEITITITSSKFQSNIDVTIYDDEWSKISSWEDQSMANRVWTTSYTLANSLPDGQYFIQLNESETDRALGSLLFNVKKYTLDIWTDSEAYLPGEIMEVFYTVTSNKDGSGVSGTSIEWKLWYYNTVDDEWDSIPGDSFTSDSAGKFLVTIPDTASIHHDPTILHIWANDTSDHWYYWPEQLDLGKIDAQVNTNSNEYLAGDFVIVNIQGHIMSGWHPLREGNVALNVSLNGVEIVTYTVNGLMLDMQGELKYIFQLQDSAETGDYIVTVNVSKEDDWDISSDMFEVVDKRPMAVQLKFDDQYYNGAYPQYYSGEMVTVTYTVFRGEDVLENVNCKYQVRDESEDMYIAVGTTSTGEFTFDIPDNYDGYLDVIVTITDSEGNTVSRSAEIKVDRASLLLKPNTNYYSPGTTIKVSYRVVGNEIENANYYYEIKDNSNIIKRESLTSSSGEFQYTVPDANVPNSYEITGYITDSSGAEISRSDVTVYRQKSFMVTFTLDKNTYKPGDEATLHYKVISLDGSEIPEEYTMSYGFYGGEPRSIQTSGSEGDLKVKVPDDAADGEGYFFLHSSDLSSSSSQQEADIRTSPNPLAETVGDVPVFSYILLILVILALLIGIAAWKHGKTALEESKLPPWKKERPLPEPEQFKDEGEEGLPPPEDETMPPPEEDVPPPSGDMGAEPSTPPETTEPPKEPGDTTPPPTY